MLSHFPGEEPEVQEVRSLALFVLIYSQSVLFLGNLIYFNCKVIIFSNCISGNCLHPRMQVDSR